MTDRLANVYADLGGTAHLVGRLYARNNRGKETASFEYEKGWLANPIRYAETYTECLRREANDTVEKANEAVEKFNCRAQGWSFC